MGTCCSTTPQTCPKTLADVWQVLNQLDVDLRTILASVNAQYIATSPVFTRNQFLEELTCPNNGLPVAVCKPTGAGTLSVDTADNTTGITIAEDAYRKVIVAVPAGAADATINGDAVEAGETVTIEWPDHATAPALTIVAASDGAGDLVRVQQFNWPV